MMTAPILAAPMLAGRASLSPIAAPRRLDLLDQVLVVILAQIQVLGGYILRTHVGGLG